MIKFRQMRRRQPDGRAIYSNSHNSELLSHFIIKSRHFNEAVWINSDKPLALELFQCASDRSSTDTEIFAIFTLNCALSNATRYSFLFIENPSVFLYNKIIYSNETCVQVFLESKNARSV